MMKHDELAFLNEQLAGMLRSGIPLESALKQLCAGMRRGDLRTELEGLRADLAQGQPLDQALAARRLPEFYVAMLRVGARSGDMPAVLTLLADYYQRVHSVWTRLKGLAVYPVIVLLAGFAVSFALSWMVRSFAQELRGAHGEFSPTVSIPIQAVWIAPTLLGLLAVAAILGWSVPSWRRCLVWVLPGFREAALSQLASSLALMVEGGCTLNDALELMRHTEGHSPAGQELARWQTRLAQGQGRVEDFAGGGGVFPPLVVWLASSAGDNLGAGLRRAADIFHGRAVQRIEMMLYAFLPTSVLLLGLMIVGQIYPLVLLLRSYSTLFDYME